MRPAIVLAVAMLALAVSVPFVSQTAMLIALFGFIFSITAIGYNIAYGYGGMISLGHAAFFGAGAYTVGLMNRHLGMGELAVLLPLSMAAAVLVALPIAPIAARLSGLQLATALLAYSMLYYSLVLKLGPITGGSDGISIGGLAVLGYEFPDRQALGLFIYFASLALTVLALFLVKRFLGTVGGRLVLAARDNPLRLEFLGYVPARAKMAAFLISAAMCGLSGALYASALQFVNADLLYWTMSGEILFMVIFGGVGTLLGPILGAFVLSGLRFYIATTPDVGIYWQLALGVIIAATIYSAPRGLIHSIYRAATLIRGSKGGGHG